MNAALVLGGLVAVAWWLRTSPLGVAAASVAATGEGTLGVGGYDGDRATQGQGRVQVTVWDRSTERIGSAGAVTPLTGAAGTVASWFAGFLGFGAFAKLPGAPESTYNVPENTHDAAFQAGLNWRIAAEALASNETRSGEQGFEQGL